MGWNIDLHVHSKFSGDTDAEPEEIILQAIERNLQGIAFTEHYSYEASEPIEPLKEKYMESIRIFRGVEFSSAEGHCLVFGVNTDALSLTYAPVEDLISVVREYGGVVIPSHPFRKGNSLGDLIQDIKGICAVEGYNGCNMSSYNARAIEVAKLLNLPYTGGSDAHLPHEVGLCYTVFSDEVRDENLIDLLKSGRYVGIDARGRRSSFWPF